VVTGPNTVVEAIAAGKRAAVMIDRFVRNKDLVEPSAPHLPSCYIEPVKMDAGQGPSADRVETPRAPAEWRKRNFSEVEVSFSIDEATYEACRCLRCDLEFTKPEPADTPTEAVAAAGRGE